MFGSLSTIKGRDPQAEVLEYVHGGDVQTAASLFVVLQSKGLTSSQLTEAVRFLRWENRDAVFAKPVTASLSTTIVLSPFGGGSGCLECPIFLSLVLRWQHRWSQ